MNSWLSLLPPLIAITLAMITRQVLLSLSIGILSGVFILSGYSPLTAFTGTIDLLVRVISDAGNARMLLFGLLIGAVVFLVQRSGGVSGFIHMLSRHQLADSPKKTGFLTMVLGMGLFLEGSMSILTVGTVAKPLFEKFKMAKEKLAYLADSTCAPVAVLIPLNGWGAYLMTQFQAGGVDEPVAMLLHSIPFFFYPITALLLSIMVVGFDWNLGPMKQAEARARGETGRAGKGFGAGEPSGKAGHFIWPMVLLILALFAFMWQTGNGSIVRGDGSKSILYATSLTIVFCFIYYSLSRVMRVAEMVRTCLDGMGHLLEVVMILALAFAINAVCRELRTGYYVAGLLTDAMPAYLIPALVFMLSALIAFATGTSWGTFAIMLSIGFPIAESLQLGFPLMVGAIVSGGVWGDHCSPISDTTVLSSLASDCTHIEHVRTQLPYAWLGGGISALGFLLAGVLI